MSTAVRFREIYAFGCGGLESWEGIEGFGWERSVQEDWELREGFEYSLLNLLLI